MERYAKAITALVVVAVSLVAGDEAVKGIDVGAVEAAVLTIIATFAVFAVPNRPS